MKKLAFVVSTFMSAISLIACAQSYTHSVNSGLFYGHGFKQLGIQFLGIASVLLWTGVTITIAYLLIKKFNGFSGAFNL